MASNQEKNCVSMSAIDAIEASKSVDEICNEISEVGFSVVEGVITPEKADEARAILEDFCQKEMTPEVERTRFQRVGRIAVKNALFRELMCHPLALAVWRRFLGEDMVCSTWTGCTLHPGWDRHTWHVDYPFWSVKAPYLPDNIAGQTVWLLDDFTHENGGTGAVPGSHKRDHPPAYGDEEWPDEAVTVTGIRGSVVFAHGAWWHCSRPNQSQKSRSCLLGMYVRKLIITQEDMRAQLAEIENPSDEIKHLMCGNQHVPRSIGETKY
jgi:ectoine hydroxylase-related dioxygenase (phytanoyl-CoA dioxygenase family)